MRYLIFTLFTFSFLTSFQVDKIGQSPLSILEAGVGTNFQLPEPARGVVASNPPVAIETPVVNKPVNNDVTGAVNASEFVAFAQTLQGTPYVYGSTDPAVGFDCSGFINYVSRHFGMTVPRSSVDFTNVGTEVARQDARPGDLILFTGTDSTRRVVGHMGIITENTPSELQFIHSSSGKAKGVTVSDLSGYYTGRFVKIIRIFPLSSDKVVA